MLKNILKLPKGTALFTTALLITLAVMAAACTVQPEAAASSRASSVPSPAAPRITFTSAPVQLVETFTPAPSATLAAATDTPTPVATATTAAATATQGPRPTLGPDDWQNLPVIPESLSKQAQLIYQMGVMKGNNPQAYSKVGDCNMTNPYFLTDFDSPGKYTLAGYNDLQGTVDYFAGSHARKSLAAKQGLTAHAVLSMLWVDWSECTSYETPLTCEFRVQKPMFALISFGTNDANGNVDFDKALRRVIEMTIGNGTLPILATKADNAEGDNSMNRTIVALANEYGLPVWNYWAAVQPLANHGLDPEHNEHLIEGPKGFTNFEADNLKYSWPVRNLTALQVLDAVRKMAEQGQ